MAAFAVSEGNAQMDLWMNFSDAWESKIMKDVKDAGEAIKAAWNKGLEDLEKLEEGPVKTAHQTCDPNPRNPKALLTELEAVGECLSCTCDGSVWDAIQTECAANRGKKIRRFKNVSI